VAAMAVIAALKPADKAEFKVLRNQKELSMSLTITKRPKAPQVSQPQ
jgi:S1-C subfamily serine protease